MKTDIEIAQESVMQPIAEIAEKLGMSADDIELYGKYKAKDVYKRQVPGCAEHYLVHIMRQHKDFLPELDFVIELDGHVIGNIMYTKAELVDENGEKKEILTFGPVSILPCLLYTSRCV